MRMSTAWVLTCVHRALEATLTRESSRIDGLCAHLPSPSPLMPPPGSTSAVGNGTFHFAPQPPLSYLAQSNGVADGSPMSTGSFMDSTDLPPHDLVLSLCVSPFKSPASQIPNGWHAESTSSSSTSRPSLPFFFANTYHGMAHPTLSLSTRSSSSLFASLSTLAGNLRPFPQKRSTTKQLVNAS